MEESKIVQPDEIKWEPHPQLAEVKVSYLLSKREENVDLTCFLVHLPVGTEMPKHIHENSDDIIYVLKGKAKMWIDGIGDVPWWKVPFSGSRKESCINPTVSRKTS